MVYFNISNMAWNKDYKKQGNRQKKEKPFYKPKRGPLKPLMAEEEKYSAKVEDFSYATALNEIEYLGQNGWVQHSPCARA